MIYTQFLYEYGSKKFDSIQVWQKTLRIANNSTFWQPSEPGHLSFSQLAGVQNDFLSKFRQRNGFAVGDPLNRLSIPNSLRGGSG